MLFQILIMSLLKFIIHVLRGKIDCPPLLGRALQLYAPSNYNRARSHKLFSIPACRTNVLRQSCIVRALSLLNTLASSAPHLDMFTTGVDRLLLESIYMLERCMDA